MSWSIRQVTDGRGRRYVIENEAGEAQTLPSVTTILGAMPKQGLDWWGFKLGVQALLSYVERADPDTYDLDYWYAACKQTQYAPHKALKSAGSRGTDVHNVAETLLRNGKLVRLPRGTKAGDGYIDALVNWHEEFSVADWEMIAIEELLFSQTHGYAGQSDFIARRPDGVVVVGDFKTSKGIYLSHHLQAAAYEHAATEMGLIETTDEVDRHVIRLSDDGTFESRMHDDVSINDFLIVKRLFDTLKRCEKKDRKVLP